MTGFRLGRGGRIDRSARLSFTFNGRPYEGLQGDTLASALLANDVLLVGRAECFFLGRPDLDETITRLKAYANAGADCLYAPGIRTREQIAAVVAAVAPKPVNLLVGAASELTMREIEVLRLLSAGLIYALILSVNAAPVIPIWGPGLWQRWLVNLVMPVAVLLSE